MLEQAILFDLPEGVLSDIATTRQVSEDFAWSPAQAASENDQVSAVWCPNCGIHASTIAIQLTYYVQEPTTLHMWCLKGHAWRWNVIEGRVVEPGKWQR